MTTSLKRALFASVSLLFLLLNFVHADSEAPAKALYQEGLRHYQNSEWKEAQEKLHQALLQDPNNPYILYNLGLAHHRLGNQGPSIAYWRKALVIMPGFDAANKALGLAIGELDKPSKSSDLSHWENFRAYFLVKFKGRFFYFFSALFLFLSTWFWVSYLSTRKKALDDELPLPPPPYLPILLSFFAICFLGLLTAKIIDSSSPRGTIVSKVVVAKSGPNDKASALFDLYEATEVLLKNKQNDWVQVSYPGGLTGWVPKNNVFQTSGDPL